LAPVCCIFRYVLGFVKLDRCAVVSALTDPHFAPLRAWTVRAHISLGLFTVALFTPFLQTPFLRSVLHPFCALFCIWQIVCYKIQKKSPQSFLNIWRNDMSTQSAWNRIKEVNRKRKRVETPQPRVFTVALFRTLLRALFSFTTELHVQWCSLNVHRSVDHIEATWWPETTCRHEIWLNVRLLHIFTIFQIWQFTHNRGFSRPLKIAFFGGDCGKKLST
jgi:hypothetical protein